MPIIEALPANYTGDLQALTDTWRDFAAVVDLTLAALSAKADDDRLEVLAEDGEPIGVVEGRDVKRKFANITWSLATGGVTNGGVGEIESRFSVPGELASWTSARAAVQASGLVGYGLWHDLGLHYLALHETAHVTQLGLETWYGCWNDFQATGQASGAYAGSAQWTYNEQVANQIAKVVGAWIAFDEIPTPNPGFPHVCNHLGLRIA